MEIPLPSKPLLRQLVATAATLLIAAATAAPAAGALAFGADAERSPDYKAGQRALAEERWADAAERFAALSEKTAAGEADASLYWLAYAESQLRQMNKALAAIERLRDAFPTSPWIDDAAALELELVGPRRSALGRSALASPPSPPSLPPTPPLPPVPAIGASGSRAVQEKLSEQDELKLYALDALLHTDSEEALPILERLLTSEQPDRIQERALFILAQSDSPKAREIVERAAKSASSPQLRMNAIRNLGIAGDEASLAALDRLAGEGTLSFEQQRAIAEALMIAGDTKRLLSLARKATDPRMRIEAIEKLGVSGGAEELRALWATEKDPQVQARLMQAFGLAGDTEFLARVAREAATPELRAQAIQGLALHGDDDAGATLRSLYRELPDSTSRRHVIEAMMLYGDGEGLVELFRQEKDPELRKAIVQRLGMVDDPAATKLLMELLGGGQ